MFIFLCWFAPGGLTLRSAGLKKGKKAPGEKLPALTPVSRQRRVWKNLACSSSTITASADRRFQFHKRSQFFIRAHNETFSVAAMCVCNPSRSPVGINR
jgi:hypothetical protein